MSSQIVGMGTVTIKDGLPQCPTCMISMVYAGKDPHPSGKGMDFFRCAECGTEFPPAEMRAAAKGAWRSSGASRRRWIVIATVVAIGLAIAAAWSVGLFR